MTDRCTFGSEIYFNELILRECQEKTLGVLSQVERWTKPLFDIKRADFYFTFDDNIASVQGEKMTAVSYESGVVIVRVFDQNYKEEELASLLFHELNHIARGKLFSVEEKPKLFNWMLLEGLAVVFERWAMQKFYQQDAVGMHENTCSESELKDGLRQILEIDESDLGWNYYDWFYNFDRQAHLPVNFAYQIGEWLVKRYCKENRVLPHQALVVSNEDFLRFGENLCAK